MPFFGNQNQTTWTGIENFMVAIWGTPADDGIADSISVYIDIETTARNCACALYEYIDYGPNYAGDIIAYTEQKMTGVGVHWVTCNFLAPKPSITAGTKYYIVLWMAAGSGYGRIGRINVAGFSIYESKAYNYPNWETPWVGESTHTQEFTIYCTYHLAEFPMGLGLKPAPKGGIGRPAMLTGGASFGG